ncbi:imelysin family protein [uncultured Tateyamaria sp.]|uniref:imelysin family protein n=1 Tax=uncultured Tateyamaria sp. TaxID=455651 RepID=UPI00263422D7|nr:imelysin family protein [uncultured Tateyamaria sp.]
MRHLCLTLALVAAPVVALADTRDAQIKSIVAGHILPRFEALADGAEALSVAAQQDCDPASAPLKAAYGTAFDAWISASHLRFGPTEVDDRAFALAFWPDSRGATPRALNALIADQDPIAVSAQGYAQVSIAARGFYALEFLLYDDALRAESDARYHCQLVRTISADIAATSRSIHDDWTTAYATVMLTPTPDGVYRTDAEVLQEMFKALSTGLQFTSESRLGRPLGTFDRPRPARAEARRSGRSAAHVALSLQSQRDLAARLAEGDMSNRLDARFDHALSLLTALDDPTFATVAAPQTRLKIEIIQQSVDAIRAAVRDDLGPTLGVAAGFNALDGD